MPSTEHEIIADMMSGGLGMLDLTIEEQRLMMEGAAEMFPLPADVRTKKIVADHVAAEWVSVDSIHTDRVMLYLHGGAYVAGSANTHRALAGRIARATKANVLLPDYRLAPEQPFPAALE
ncbi:MAG: alpha/beta hydrolase fold domain-containing protein, partial [Pseudomonadales bacterium]|nr:alpha/beta hydrolase fold domain-containing protein [Pseudomonadales bacterium]